MDCRRSLPLLALGLIGACAGCISQPLGPPGSAAQLAALDTHKASPAPPRKPTADLCVAAGRYCEESAEQASDNPQQQHQLYEEARKEYQRALDLDAKHKDALLALGRLYVKLEDYDRAMATYAKALKKHPKEPAVWLEQGICQCRKKDWAGALESMRKAHTLDPENRVYATQYGLCLARASRYDDSLACLSKVMPKAEAHFNVARMMEHLNHPEESRQQLRLALQLKPDLAPAQQMLARLDAGTPGGVVNVGFETPAP
jgi:tetratricopeptide (TPR) repeat protein